MQVPQGQRGAQVSMDQQAQPVKEDPLGLQVLRVTQVLPALPVQRVLPVPMVQPAQPV